MVDHTLQKQMIHSGAAFSGLAVAIGAFGAHELKDMLDEQAMETFETAVRYQFYHAFAILIVASLLRKVHPKYARPIFQLFVWGIIIFSGSLYIVATRELTFKDDIKWVGGLTPIGGILFLGGWALFAFKGFRLMNGSENKSRHNTRHRSSDSETREENNPE